jgi:hypothetical protein
MTDAKVDPEVLKAYVRTSMSAYNLSAAEIIALKERGISAEILTTMIQRGGELRGQALRSGQPAMSQSVQPVAPGTATPYAPAPAYDYSTQPVYPADTYSYPAYSYAYPVDSYSYPAYSYGYLGFGLGGYYGGYNCGYYWPSAY